MPIWFLLVMALLTSVARAAVEECSPCTTVERRWDIGFHMGLTMGRLSQDPLVFDEDVYPGDTAEYGGSRLVLSVQRDLSESFTLAGLLYIEVASFTVVNRGVGAELAYHFLGG